LTLTEIEREYPEAFAACARSFPLLVAERSEHQLQVRSRAFHHLGEVRRVKVAAQVLQNFSRPHSGGEAVHDVDAAMRLLGNLLNESHESLRDLYEVSTPHVE